MENELNELNELRELRRQNELSEQSNQLISALIATFLIETDVDNLEMSRDEIVTFLESLVDLIKEELDLRNAD